jgi:DNA adenine methylase
MPSAARAEPLLRWAGSKRGLLHELVRRRPPGNWRYVEPFAGSACLFFALAPQEAVLGDLNRELIAAYRVVRERPLQVADQVHAWATDSRAYYRIRAQADGQLGPVEAAARFIYLNRLCFNGVYRTNRLGEFNVPYGRRSGAVPARERFATCAKLLQSAELRDGDFESTLGDAGKGDFVYLDPPYSRALSDAYGVYGYGSFDAADLDRLLAYLQQLDERGSRVLLSYTWHPLLAQMGDHWHLDEVAVRSQVGGTANSRSTRREVLVTNYNWS